MATGKAGPRRTPKEKAAIADGFSSAGLSKQAYAEQVGIHPNTLTAYLEGATMAARKKKKASKRSGRQSESNGRFVEASETAASLPAPRKVSAEVAELQALVKQQAAVLARLL